MHRRRWNDLTPWKVAVGILALAALVWCLIGYCRPF
jgi:hypothetical protein